MAVVQRRKPVIAGHRRLEDHPSEGVPVEQKRRNEGSALVADDLLPQIQGDAETLESSVRASSYALGSEVSRTGLSFTV